MNWGFLGEFWDSITSQTLTAWQYTADWFKQIGLAVAGAIGGLFDYLIHYFNDVFVFLGWLFNGIKELASAVMLPIAYIGNFLKGFITNAIKTPLTPETSYTFSTSTMEIFETIPHWNSISSILGVAILILGGFAILRLITKV